ncbi:GFA family protein [Pontixanthobacter sp.]|uniref:GFA family protein n=1 Tax=Pontixanthobacter sp. TaxID=2792078 RepID=UPI003C7C62EF
MAEGGCQCGAVRYAITGDLERHALCHCSDCRASSGAPMMGWLVVEQARMQITKGTPQAYQSSENASRHFCATCGTGLFYYNPVYLPGMVDVQSCTLDDPDAAPAGAHIMVTERVGWMEHAHDWPQFETFPGE